MRYRPLFRWRYVSSTIPKLFSDGQPLNDKSILVLSLDNPSIDALELKPDPALLEVMVSMLSEEDAWYSTGWIYQCRGIVTDIPVRVLMWPIEIDSCPLTGRRRVVPGPNIDGQAAACGPISGGADPLKLRVRGDTGLAEQ